MRFCTSCGHELGVGRFCTNCGHPIDRTTARGSTTAPSSPLPSSAPSPASATLTTARTGADDEDPGTAERRAARRQAAMQPTPPRTPPSAADTPPAPRYPLYADEVAPDHTATDHTATGTHRLDPVPAAGLLDRFAPDHDGGTGHAGADQDWHEDWHEDDDGDRDRRETRRRWPLLLAVLLAVVLAAAVVGWRVLGGPGDEPTANGGGSAEAAPAGRATDLTAQVTAMVPGNAPPATEIGGGRATFVAANLLDAEPSTAWRVAGDASGQEIVLRLPRPATINQVGLVNGYAKTATDEQGRRFDWYLGNRRVLAVTWVLDGDTRVEQELTQDRSLQLLDVDPVTTDTVTLRLRTVSEPGRGRAGRDFTAVGDVALLGTPVT